MMYFTMALLSVFATYGISYTLVYLDGAFGVIEKFRDSAIGSKIGALYCVPCLSFWVAIPISYLFMQPYWYVTFLGVWSAAIFLDVFASNRMV